MSGDSLLAHFDAEERKTLRGLTTPVKIQRFLDDLCYNLETVDTCYSPRTVLRKGVAHCMEGAMLGAMALRRLGYPPLIVDLEAVRDSDHVLAVYRVNGYWGAVAVGLCGTAVARAGLSEYPRAGDELFRTLLQSRR